MQRQMFKPPFKITIVCNVLTSFSGYSFVPVPLKVTQVAFQVTVSKNALNLIQEVMFNIYIFKSSIYKLNVYDTFWSYLPTIYF